MSVDFKGFSGLQTAPQHTLLINQDTWCISFFVRLLEGSSTDSDILNSTYIFSCDPTYTQASQIWYSQGQPYSVVPVEGWSSFQIDPSPDNVMQFVFQKSYDPSLVGIYGAVAYGGEWATAFIDGVAAFSTHHVLMYGVPRQLVDPEDPNGEWTQGLYLYLDGMPCLIDQDLGTGYDPYTATGDSAIDPYLPANHTRSPDFSIRLGNFNFNQRWPNRATILPPGEVSFSLWDVAIWHGWTPISEDIVALRDQSKTPDEVGTGLQCWWKLDGTSGQIVTGDAPGLVNLANPGTHNLAIV